MASRRLAGERGQGTLEYVGVAVLVAIIVAAIVAFFSGGAPVVDAVATACHKVTQSACGGSVGGDGSTVPPSDGSHSGGTGSSDPTGTSSDDVPLPDGLDANSEIVKRLLETERGRATLKWLADNNIPITVDPNATGAFWNGKEIVLGPGYDDAAVLVHEANHAKYTVEGRHGDAKKLDRDAYVDGAVSEEADGTVQQILAQQEFRDKTGDKLPQAPGEPEFTKAYDDAYAAAKKAGQSEADATTAALAAGAARVKKMFVDGDFRTSTTGESYMDYYGDYWDSVN